jgi:hypothetical protein
MSSWWYYDFAVYGDPEKLRELEKTLPDMTYENRLDEQVPVFYDVEIEYQYGFLAVHASRNYGSDAPLHHLCGIFPNLTFGGIFHHQTALDRYWSWEIRNGLLDVECHVDEECDWEGREITADEIKAKIKKLTAKIATLTQELSQWKYQLVRYHGGQIGNALTEEEAKELAEIVDADVRRLALRNELDEQERQRLDAQEAKDIIERLKARQAVQKDSEVPPEVGEPEPIRLAE